MLGSSSGLGRWPFTPEITGSNAVPSTICLVLSRYRVWTHTLCGSNRPETDPEITASALGRKHLTPKFAR